MKTTILLISVALLSSCTIGNQVSDQAKGNLSLGFSTKKVDAGYEVSGHAGTNVFGLEPYVAFKAGFRYNPKNEELDTVLVSPEPK